MAGRLYNMLPFDVPTFTDGGPEREQALLAENLSEITALFADAPPFYIADLCGNFIFVNNAYHRLSVLAHNRDAVGEDTFPEPAFPLDEVLANVIAMNAGTTRAENLKTTDGIRSFRSNHYPVHDTTGMVIAIAGMYTDVSNETTEDLAQLVAQDRFDDITRLITDMVWETDVEFNLVYVSSRVNEVLEIHPREIIGRNIFEIGAFEKGEEESTRSLPTKKTRSPFRNLAFNITLPDGRKRRLFLSGLPMFSNSGGFRGFRGTATEISDESEARKNASLSRERLTAAIENISEGFALFDADQRLILFNTRFKEYLAGIARYLVPGIPFHGIVEAAASSGFVVGPGNALSEWRDLHGAAAMKLAANTELHLASGRWIKVSDRSTEDGGVVTIVSDVTEIKNREEALRTSKELAEQGNKSKSEFLANMSHELRTPLNAIIGFTEIMRDEAFGPVGNERYHEYIEDILDSGRHLLGIINDILDVSKAEAGKLELHEEKVRLNHEVDAVLRLFTEQAAAAKIDISAKTSEDLPCLMADQRKIRQILLNLISNAVKFTPEGGRVTIEGGLEEDGRIALRVIDTGIGIKEEDIPAALSPFGQVESSLSRRYDGTGLGLPLTRALVVLHNGEMKLESKIDEGTCVSILFPKERVVNKPRL